MTSPLQFRSARARHVIEIVSPGDAGSGDMLEYWANNSTGARRSSSIAMNNDMPMPNDAASA
jgi:hypothetical protein